MRRLAWLVQFVQRPGLGALKGRALDDANADVEYFAAGVSRTLGHGQTLTARSIEDFAFAVRIGLETYYKTNNPWEIRVPTSANLVIYMVRTPSGKMAGYRCPDLNLAALLTARDLIDEQASVIKVCARSSTKTACGRLFVVHGRKEFCSPLCSQMERTARWRRQNRATVNEARRLAYQRSVARQQGRKIKDVQIQPRGSR
jgi:hypothetical protein